MEAPEDVVLALAAIRPTMRLRHVPLGKVVGGSSYDAGGKPRELVYEPRWELWDTDADGVDYKLTTLEDENGGYRPPDMRIVELCRLINPERYDGNLDKMVQALIDEPNNYIEGLHADRFDELVGHLGDLYWHSKTPFVTVARSLTPAR